MGWIIALIVGGVAGWLASLVMNRDASMGIFWNVVVGCVGVTRKGGRTGKGGGFADLELGIFRELGTVSENTPIVTTVHSIQVVADDQIVMLQHDSALHWIVTEQEVIETKSPYPQPSGVAWDVIQQDQLDDIPFLRKLKADILSRRSS